MDGLFLLAPFNILSLPHFETQTVYGFTSSRVDYNKNSEIL